MLPARTRRSLLAIGTAVLMSVIGSGAPVAGADPEQAAVPPRSVNASPDPALTHESTMLALGRLIEETGALGTYGRGDETVVVVPTSGRSSFTVRDARDLGLDVTIETADLERDEIALIKGIAADRAWHPEAAEYQSGAAFDARIGKIRLMSNAPAYVYDYFEENFPGKTVFEQKTLTLASRKNDWEPHWGGACIVEHGAQAPYCDPDDSQDLYCTSGFSVKTATGKHRMVTAGHCFPVGTSIRSPIGTTFGSVTANPWWGSVGNAGDMALVGKGTNDITMGPAIYVGGSTGTQANVLSASNPAIGTKYCFSGATTFSNCGHEQFDNDFDACGIDDRNPNACHYNVQLYRNLAGQGSCGGDSGGPFYLESVTNPGSVYIRGMVVLGELDPCSDNTIVGIETWPKISNLLNVTIKTV